MVRKVLNISSAVSAILLLGMMNMLTPSEAGPLGVLVFFTLFYVICFGLARFLCQSFFDLKWKIKGKKGKAPSRKAFYFGSIIAFGPVMLLAMQSFGGVSLWEVFLVTLLVAIICFFVSKKA